MSFFRNFLFVDYNFGNEINPAIFQNITTYIDLIDQVADNSTFYEEYFIKDGERPDIVSYELYGTVDYYWTFFLLNASLRQQGWPLDEQDVYTKAKEYYPNQVFLTRYKLFNEFFLNDYVIAGSTSNPSFKGIIREKKYDLGQIIVEPIVEVRNQIDINNSIEVLNGGSGYTSTPTVTISGGGGKGAKAVASLSSGSVQSITVTNRGSGYTSAPTVKISNPTNSGDVATAKAYISSNNIGNGSVVYSFPGELNTWPSLQNVSNIVVHTSVKQHAAPHHYEDADGNWVDLNLGSTDTDYIDNESGSGLSGKTKITYEDRLKSENDKLRTIKVFTPSAVTQIDNEFQRLLRQ